MSWENPKTNWGQSGQTVPIADDFNRIEGNILHLQDTKETPAGAQAKANTAEANAKAYTDAHEQKAAPHSGHETPAGAQAKAYAAETNAKNHANSLVGTLSNLLTTAKNNVVAAINEIFGKVEDVEGDLESHKADGTQHAKTARFVVGTSTAGWTLEDCDYLCDGTNDQEEIIQALNDLPATGGEIVILDGIYNITASINIPKDNVSLRGNGNATILKRMYNSTDTNSGPTAKGLITLNEKSGCKIQGLQIDGNKATYTANYNYGIYLYSSSDNTVTSNTCNNSNNGIRFDSSSNENIVTGNTCNSNSNGIRFDSSSNNTITGNTCNNSNNGIRLYLSSNNNTITGNTCNNNSSNGIYLYSSSSNNTITGNTCIRGTGQTSDYASDQYTIQLQGTNNYNLISSNNCMGKAPVVEGGTGNTLVNNKFDDSDDIQTLAEQISTVSGEIDELYPTRYLFGMVPSDTVLASHTETVFTNYSAWKTYPKCFVCKNGGKYRVTFDYSAPTTNYGAEFYIASGSGIKLTETVSKEPGASGSVTLDTTIDISAGDSIKIMWRAQGGEGLAFMYGASIKGTLVATAMNLTLTGVTVADIG